MHKSIRKLIQQSFLPSVPNGVKRGLIRVSALLGVEQQGPAYSIVPQSDDYAVTCQALVSLAELPYNYQTDTRDLYYIGYLGQGDRPW